MNFNLEYYRTFYYVCKLGSTTKAAEALFLSQPAVSQTIQKLEDHMGCSLFMRTSKGMQHTAEGDILFQYVSKAFNMLLDGEKKVQRLSEYKAGELNVGTTETALYYFLLSKIESFRVRFPNVRIHVTGSSTSEIFRLVRTGTADLAVVMSPLEDTDKLTVQKVQSFQDIFVVGSSFSHLRGRLLSTQELAKEPIVCLESGTSARKHIDNWFDSQGVFFQPDYSVRTTTQVIPFVERNMAIGILPSVFAQNLINEGNFFQLQPETDIPSRQLYVIYRENYSASALRKVFINHLLAQ